MSFKYQGTGTQRSTLLFLLSAKTIEACEKNCRQSISDAFAERYRKVDKPIWVALSNNVTSSVLSGVNLRSYLPTKVAASVKTEIMESVKSHIKRIESEFDNSLSTLVYDSIFHQSPPFMGDCHKRVKQPPIGVSWTEKDCEKMNFICGNPPSICHFFGLIKKRNVKTINSALENGISDYETTLFSTVHTKLSKSGLTTNQITKLSLRISKNIKTKMGIFPKAFKSSFCNGKSCDKFDEALKHQLLTFP
ncbi:hypothetical protein G9A89_014325 [Geosiphon pyriformis]|nr:hypothetical protein G9A89_014325 [Geosiphon pyriformis]